MRLIPALLAGLGLWLVWSALWERPPRKKTGRSRWSDSVRDQLIHAGIQGVTPGGLVFSSLMLGIVTGVAIGGIARAPAIGGAFGTMAALLPVTIVRSRANKRRTQLREVWPEVVDHLTSGIRAGMALPEAISAVAHRGPHALRPDFESFAQDYRATGRFAESLDRLKDRLADPVADRIIEALRLTREVGGSDLGRLLRTLSGFLREDARTRGELVARQSWTVNAARLATAAPWIVLALLALRPEAAAAFNTTGGYVVIAGTGIVTVIAYRLMMRIGRLPQEARVLR